MTTDVREVPYVTVTDVAKLIRARLKLLFPGDKFSVRSERYSGGAAIDVRWTDGPTQKEVDEVVWRYRGVDFDGMTDSTTYHDSTVIIDGEEVTIRSGAHYVQTHRDYSPEFAALIEATAEDKMAGDFQCAGCYRHVSDQGFYAPLQRRATCSVECYGRVERHHVRRCSDGTILLVGDKEDWG